MRIETIRTHKIEGKEDILAVINKYVKNKKDGSILAVTSKIVSICEKNVIKIGDIEKKDLIVKECDYYLPDYSNKYNVCLTIKNNIMISSAGIDESNGNGFYILWPKNPQKTANKIRKFLSQKYKLKNFGVIITDSKSTPLRRGTSGVAISHSGFYSLNNYIGESDIFGRKLKMTKADVVDSLAIAAVLTMGEGNEQTPMVMISDIPFIKFRKENPSLRELSELKVKMKDDYHRMLFENVKWEKGGCGK